MTRLAARAIAVDCPTCGASSGQLCDKPLSIYRPDSYHASRIAAATAAPRAANVAARSEK